MPHFCIQMFQALTFLGPLFALIASRILKDKARLMAVILKVQLLGHERSPECQELLLKTYEN